MAFVTGNLLIDAPASALNNLGSIDGANAENATGVKHIRVRGEAYPYVSAQAFRYWLRQTLEEGDWGWQAAPIYREKKVAYTDANPIRYWDDDLLGYMRAPSKKASAVEAREADQNRGVATPVNETVTRISPFRVSTLVSLGPTSIVDDFGVMARHEGDPVPYEHQFYRTTLNGLISLDLHAAGTFSFKQKTGYQNLDDVRIEEAKKANLEELQEEKAYRLPFQQRIERVAALLQGLVSIQGGAKQTTHYTDVNPDLIFLAVTKGGNNIFGHIFGIDSKNRPVIKHEALEQVLTVFKNEILSDIYVGWVTGYLDEERNRFIKALDESSVLSEWKNRIKIQHPRTVMDQLVNALAQHPQWLD